jgi:outer membrane protein TolC
MNMCVKRRKLAAATAACVLVACLPVSAAQAPSRDLTLKDAVATAFANNPSLRSANLGVDLAEARIAERRAERLPAVTVSESMTRSNNPVFVFGSLLEQARFGQQNFDLRSLNNPPPLTNLRTSVTVTVPAFDGFKTSARVEQARGAHTQAELMKNMAEHRLRLTIVREYFGVLLAEAARDTADEALVMAEADLELARARLDAGLSVRSDFLGAQVQLAEFRQQRIKTVGDVTTARARLNLAIGVAADSVYRLPDAMSALRFQIPPQDELLQAALTRRFDYASAVSAVAVADKAIAESRSDYLPQLKMFGSVGSSGRSLTTGSGDYAFGATLSLSLFDRGRSARLDQVHIGKNLADVERERVADQIRLDVIAAYQNFIAAEEQTGVAEAGLAQADEALKIVRDRYMEGLNTITDLLHAETALVRARLNVVATRHAYYVGYANVLFTAGLLTDVDVLAQRGGTNE